LAVFIGPLATFSVRKVSKTARRIRLRNFSGYASHFHEEVCPFMNKLFLRSCSIAILITSLLVTTAAVQGGTQTASPSPSDTVREFFKAMRERRIREAFAMSIYKPAIEGLKPDEFADLQPDFEKVAGKIPEKVDITGEQISGDQATVFMKVPRDDDPTQMDAAPIPLMRSGGRWIIGDKENQQIVKKAGKRFFLNARIETHQTDVNDMLLRINVAQLIYKQQHDGVFADLPTLISVGLVPKDIEGTESTGYHFHLTLAKDAKSYVAGAEPARYGRTGRLSFLLENGKIKSADTSGKPLN
jgi:hypothetical protein